MCAARCQTPAAKRGNMKAQGVRPGEAQPRREPRSVVRTNLRTIQWNQLSENPAPEGRSSLAQRLSAGKSGGAIEVLEDDRVLTRTPKGAIMIGPASAQARALRQ